MNDLIPSISVPGLLAERISRIDAAQALLAAPEQRAFVEYLLKGRIFCKDDHELMANYTQHVDRDCWKTFIQASGLWDLFPRDTRDEWMRALGMGDYQYRELQECPPFTAESALATFQAYAEQKGELRKQALLSLYRRLSWDHKTNQPALFGKKLIYTWFTDRRGFMNFDASHLMDDLLRELYRLDGKPEPVGGWNQRDNTVGYFRVVTFKNGNGHIHLERLDLVDRLNAELASYCPGALPAPRP
jgi:hypothetical protein